MFHAVVPDSRGCEQSSQLQYVPSLSTNCVPSGDSWNRCFFDSSSSGVYARSLPPYSLRNV